MPAENATTITPFLWFNGNAEQAVNFYLTVFPDAKKTGGLPGPDGKPLTISFHLLGSHFTALNGDRDHAFKRVLFSFVVNCKDQAEIDHYWEKLKADGGEEVQCGWLKDRFGLFWQIVPTSLVDLLQAPGAMMAMMSMKKLDMAALQAAGQAPLAVS